jgi:hypothetical protein
MKIALYIEDGLEQIVLTPTSDTEKAMADGRATRSNIIRPMAATSRTTKAR